MKQKISIFSSLLFHILLMPVYLLLFLGFSLFLLIVCFSELVLSKSDYRAEYYGRLL